MSNDITSPIIKAQNNKITSYIGTVQYNGNSLMV